GTQEEAEGAARSCALSQKPGHYKQAKWIGDPGTVNPDKLGKKKNYTHKMDIEAEPGTRAWLKKFETKKSTQPGRYEIPHDRIDEFNSKLRSIQSSPRNANKGRRR